MADSLLLIRLQHVSEFVFGTNNAAFVQVMYEQYLRDPASVSEEWRQLFDNGKTAQLPVIPTSREEAMGGGGRGKGPPRPRFRLPLLFRLPPPPFPKKAFPRFPAPPPGSCRT